MDATFELLNSKSHQIITVPNCTYTVIDSEILQVVYEISRSQGRTDGLMYVHTIWKHNASSIVLTLVETEKQQQLHNGDFIHHNFTTCHISIIT